MTECIAYNRNKQVCKNGFVQKQACWKPRPCHSCGTFTKASLPYCMREELPAHYVNDDGSPRFGRKGELGVVGGSYD